MGDIEEIIDYFKSLKKGFDKELFQSKIEELAFLVENAGVHYDDFQTLFKIWLNLSIPVPKWVNLGVCLVPQEKVKKSTVEYSLQWILANYDNPNSTSRTGFVLDWLTVAMDFDSVDMNALDIGYEVFYTMLTYEALTVHVMKLLYTLTKPADVTRKRVVELLDVAKKREGKKSIHRQIQVLLGLFKSYKPQYVPENVPSISIHTAFRNINPILITRFKNSQAKRNSISKEKVHLLWTNPLISISGKKKVDSLIPSMEFANLSSHQYDGFSQKNYLDFPDPVSLVQYSSRHAMRRPARLRALLSNPAGLMLLVTAPDSEHAFLSHDLQHLLTNCFLEASPYSYVEKQDLLQRLAIFQATLMQGLPVVTRFLAQYLPFWNEKDFFDEILKLIQWVNVEGADHVQVILDSMAKLYHRAQPVQQCAVLGGVTAMYTNLVYGSTRPRQYFLSTPPSQASYTNVLAAVASRLSDITDNALQVSPDSACALYGAVRCNERRARAEMLCARRAGAPPRLLSFALPLLSPSAAAIDALAELVVLYKKIFSVTKASCQKDEQYVEEMKILKRYTSDFVRCFYEEFLSERKKGIVFSNLQSQVVSKLSDVIPDVDSQLSIRNHLAFAPYTYLTVQTIDARDENNRIWFKTVIEEEFASLSHFIKVAMPELC